MMSLFFKILNIVITNSLNAPGLPLWFLMFFTVPSVNTVQLKPKHTCEPPEQKTDTGLLTHEWDALSNEHKNANELQRKKTKEFKGFLDCLL